MWATNRWTKPSGGIGLVEPQPVEPIQWAYPIFAGLISGGPSSLPIPIQPPTGGSILVDPDRCDLEPMELKPGGGIGPVSPFEPACPPNPSGPIPRNPLDLLPPPRPMEPPDQRQALSTCPTGPEAHQAGERSS